MRPVLVPLLLLTSAAAAQPPEIAVTPHALRTMTTTQLRALLFDSDAPAFVESWVEGPTRRLAFLDVQLAARPNPTAYLGLCSVAIGHASARWEIGKQTEDAPLKMSRGRVDHFFVLADDRPSLARGKVDAEPCAERSPLFDESAPRPIRVFYTEGSDLTFTDADAARFGFTALRAAQDASGRVRVTTQRCDSGFTDIPTACNAPADFLRTREPRDVAMLMVSRCDGAATLCADVTIARSEGCGLPTWAGPCGEDHVVVTTDLRTLADGDALDATHVRSIEIRAGSNPVA